MRNYEEETKAKVVVVILNENKLTTMDLGRRV
jgi:hypothetical protein